MQIQSYAHRMRVGLRHRVRMPQAARPGELRSYLSLTSFYQSSGMSPFPQDVFPGCSRQSGEAVMFLFYFL